MGKEISIEPMTHEAAICVHTGQTPFEITTVKKKPKVIVIIEKSKGKINILD